MAEQVEKVDATDRLKGFVVRSSYRIFPAVLVMLFLFSPGVFAGDGPIGWASVSDYGQVGTTGGAGGPTVTVTSAGDFLYYATQTTPYIIQVLGDITVGAVHVRSDKTIIGLGTDATLRGQLSLSGVRNIIIRNLNIRADHAVEGDAISISGSHHIWIDRCAIFNAPDGLIDITNASDYVTVSWCRFFYTSEYPHRRLTNLIGASDGALGDAGRLRVTMHHNWWGARCDGRMPSVRFGRVHIFNNFFNSPGNNYCIRSRIGAQVLVENNFFQGVSDPHEIHITTGVTGLLRATGNIYQNTTGRHETNDPANVFVPPYAYTLIPAANVPAVVMAGSGPQLPNVIDHSPPTPNPMTWAVPPHGISTTAISMTAATASDDNGVLYMFISHTPGGHSSGWQGSPTFISTGLQPGTTYAYTVIARDVFMNQTAPSAMASAATRTPSTVAPIRINFQPTAPAVPAGYLPDYGLVFGDRGNGHFYGWNFSHTDMTRLRTQNTDPVMGTIIHINTGGIWEMGLPNGEYFVEVCIGDPDFSATHTVNVEGVNFWNAQFLAPNSFLTHSQTIQVNDGRLTIDQGTAGGVAAQR
ncbi:MAG TPA: hypothetical protein VLH60_04530, partial [Sedimentisphaerales bacterium]|nr:hypothetical protein [Sedimentisphaerales bacterium]